MTYLKNIKVNIKERFIFFLLAYILPVIGVVLYYFISKGDDDVSKIKRYVALQFIIVQILAFFISIKTIAWIVLVFVFVKIYLLQLLFAPLLLLLLVLNILLALYAFIYCLIFVLKGRCDMIAISPVAERYIF